MVKGQSAFMISAWNWLILLNINVFKKVKSVMEGRPREMCLTHIYCITSRMVVRILPSKRSKYGSLTTQLNCPNWDSYSYHRCVRELVEAFGDIKRSRYFKQGFW